MRTTTAVSTIAASIALAAGGAGVAAGGQDGSDRTAASQPAHASCPPPPGGGDVELERALAPGTEEPRTIRFETACPADAEGTPSASPMRFVACMREQGAELPAPPEPGETKVLRRTEATDGLREAEAACREHLGDVVVAAQAAKPRR